MIARADFALQREEQTAVDSIDKIGLRDLTSGSLILPIIRKPDFQRETNHWSPEQVVSLLECYVNGDLIPSVILWKSPLYLFVIDGGHRLSALRAWAEDDYGDGATSQSFFTYEISKEQRRIAKRTRDLIDDRIGKYAHINARMQQPDIPDDERRRGTALASRALHIQWVSGNAGKAEESFFKINTEGTPLDGVEELLLRNRRRPIAIAARAVIRAGKGHRYWSAFPSQAARTIEVHANNLHQILFEPELKRPVKTLDLPLGGSKGVRAALEVLIDFMVIANRNQAGTPARLEDYADDSTGEATVQVLEAALRLATRITGNDRGSLGLHPAVYFYGPSGVHSGPMFMGTVALIARKLANNDGNFFRKFSQVRAAVEKQLVGSKDLIATILQKLTSPKRARAYELLLEALISKSASDETPDDEWFVDTAGVRGKVLTGAARTSSVEFSDHTKSRTFIAAALDGAVCCEICGGYLDAEKSLSYDHERRRRDGGTGDANNIRLAHPFCNQSVKN
jgi:hypothetical protein